MRDTESTARRHPTFAWGRLAVVGIVAAIAVSGAVWALRPVPEGVAFEEVRYAAAKILCDCGCNPQSVHDCACGRADEMWAEIAARVEGGLTGEQVVEAYVAERGEQVLVAPVASGFNLVAWVGPLVALVVAGVLLLVLIRSWSKRAAPQEATAHVPSRSVDPDDADRVRREMESYP